MQDDISNRQDDVAPVRYKEVFLDHLAVVEVLVDGNRDRRRALVAGVEDRIDRAFFQYQLGVVGADVAVLGRDETAAAAAYALNGVVAEGDQHRPLERDVLVEELAAVGEIGTVVDLLVGGDFKADELDGVAMAAAVDGIVGIAYRHNLVAAHGKIAVDRLDAGLHQRRVVGIAIGLYRHGVETRVVPAERHIISGVEQVKIAHPIGAVAFVEMQQKAEHFGIGPRTREVFGLDGFLRWDMQTGALPPCTCGQSEEKDDDESVHGVAGILEVESVVGL